MIPLLRVQSLKVAVFGEPSIAEKGKLICVPAGPEASVARIKPYLVGVYARCPSKCDRSY